MKFTLKVKVKAYTMYLQFDYLASQVTDAWSVELFQLKDPRILEQNTVRRGIYRDLYYMYVQCRKQGLGIINITGV